MKWKIGDILKSEYGYKVRVYRDTDGSLSGKLICERGHSCENIRYSLSGRHTLLRRK